jgi:hypothetical protein
LLMPGHNLPRVRTSGEGTSGEVYRADLEHQLVGAVWGRGGRDGSVFVDSAASKWRGGQGRGDGEEQ